MHSTRLSGHRQAAGTHRAHPRSCQDIATPRPRRSLRLGPSLSPAIPVAHRLIAARRSLPSLCRRRPNPSTHRVRRRTSIRALWQIESSSQPRALMRSISASSLRPRLRRQAGTSRLAKAGSHAQIAMEAAATPQTVTRRQVSRRFASRMGAPLSRHALLGQSMRRTSVMLIDSLHLECQQNQQSRKRKRVLARFADFE